MGVDKRFRRRIILTLIALPMMIAALVLTGVFIGYYLAGIYKSTSILFPLIFSGIGFAVSLVLSYLIAKRVASSK